MRRTGWVVVPALLALHPPVAAQSPRLVVGLVGGYTTTEHSWSRSAETSRVGGTLVGGFLDVETPLEWLSAGVELAYVQRGSDVLLDVGGVPSPGGIRADVLSFAIRVRAILRLGRARFHVVAGPMGDFVVRGRLDPLLVQILEEESPASFGVLAGGGVGLRVTGAISVDLEARVVEGLQPAYSGAFIDTRTRAREMVLRVGILVGQ